MPPPSERRTSQPYRGYSTTTQMSSTTLRPPRLLMEQKSWSKFLPWPGI